MVSLTQQRFLIPALHGCTSYRQDLRRYINILNLFAPVRKNCRKLLGGVGECDCGWLRVTVLVLSHESRKWDFLARFRFVKVVSENDFVLRHQVHVEIILWVDKEEDGHVHLHRTDRSAFDVCRILPKVIIQSLSLLLQRGLIAAPRNKSTET